MVERKSDVFVEVEHFDAGPVDTGSCGEELKEVDLGGAGGGNDACGLGLG
jgi:hypothetical protein